LGFNELEGDMIYVGRVWIGVQQEDDSINICQGGN
jgi:hypothetical protein